MSPINRVAACVLVGVAKLIDGADFLHAQHHPGSSYVTKQEVQDLLLSELSGYADSARLKAIEQELQPMHAALPKREGGKLDPSTVRYALHRYFVQKHGWYVAGLDPAGNSWNSSEPSAILKGRSPAYIQTLFEEQLHGRGFGLHELAVFAATLSDLIHKEAVDMLVGIYWGLGLSTEQPVSRAQSAVAIKAYLAAYLIGEITIGGISELNALEREMPEVYPEWLETLLWIQDLRISHDLKRKSTRNPFMKQLDSFDETASFMLDLGHNFGTYQNLGCSALKNKLVDLEHQGTGRVPLSRFYSGGLEGDWQFVESVEYLRNIGVLDETDERRPSVMIPNYMISQSNCLTSSSFYSVCCSDECEALMLHLESNIAAPFATPARIAEVVSSLPSDTVVVPRNLSMVLVKRLDEIAGLHGGTVPMHGRLFAQWMHHSYPRECPFPHLAGTMSPMSPDEWMAINGVDNLQASEDDMMMHNSVTLEELDFSEDSVSEAIPWTFVEELVATHLHESPTPTLRWSVSSLRPVMAFVALVSVALPLARAASALAPSSHSKSDRCLV